MDIKAAAEKIVEARMEIGKVISGYSEEIMVLLTTLFANGHVLIEAVPGTGKTLMLKALTAVMGGTGARIQGTSGVMDTDIIGLEVFNRKTNDFDIKHGVFKGVNFVLVDEVNRLLDKTTSALLEAFEERQYTIAGQTLPVENPFMGMLTQNPIDHSGTSELTSALYSRMMSMIILGYVSEQDEFNMLRRPDENADALDKLNTVFTLEEIAEVQQLARKVLVDDKILWYITQLVRATREHRGVKGGGYGAPPRSAVQLLDMTKAGAVASGRSFAIPQDVLEFAPYVLTHAIMSGFQDFDNSSITEEEIIQDVLASTPIPEVKLPATVRPALEIVRSA